MQLLFYEGATNTVTTGLAYVIPNETAELKTKLLYLFFALDYAYSYSLWNRPLVISNYKLIKLKSSFRILISVPIVRAPQSPSCWKNKIKLWVRGMKSAKCSNDFGQMIDFFFLKYRSVLDSFFVCRFFQPFLFLPPCFCCFTKEIRGIGVG